MPFTESGKSVRVPKTLFVFNNQSGVYIEVGKRVRITDVKIPNSWFV
jgi:hypothetical protein